MAPTDPSPSRRLRLVLFASLALNVLILATVIGASFGPVRNHPGGRRGPDAALRGIGNVPFVMALEREDRDALVEALNLRQGDFRRNREALRARFEAVLGVLRAAPFDAEALRGLLANQRTVLFERQKLGEELLLARLAAMSEAERAAYADRLDQSLRRGPRRDETR